VVNNDSAGQIADRILVEARKLKNRGFPEREAQDYARRLVDGLDRGEE
jgi:hypothetical protein